MDIKVFGWSKIESSLNADFSEQEFARKLGEVFNETGLTVNIVFVDNAEIRKLNMQFRQKAEPTDVLSFNLNEDEQLGEVYVSLEFLKEQERLRVDEVLRMIVHGILHLLGYEHNSYFEYSENSMGDSIGIAHKYGATVEKMFVEQEKRLMSLLESIKK